MFYLIDSTIKESNEDINSNLVFKTISSFKNNPCVILMVSYKHIPILLLFSCIILQTCKI